MSPLSGALNTVVNGNGIQVYLVNKQKIPIKCVLINRELLYRENHSSFSANVSLQYGYACLQILCLITTYHPTHYIHKALNPDPCNIMFLFVIKSVFISFSHVRTGYLIIIKACFHLGMAFYNSIERTVYYADITEKFISLYTRDIYTSPTLWNPTAKGHSSLTLIYFYSSRMTFTELSQKNSSPQLDLCCGVQWQYLNSAFNNGVKIIGPYWYRYYCNGSCLAYWTNNQSRVNGIVCRKR